ncbi:MAG TPA: hypothetical protein VGR53_09905 [Nitrososphaerales archaeon]|nr:hypothetical protein [Nitrososphaerales archaeon]
MSFRRDLLVGLRGFDESFGRSPGSLMGKEEDEIVGRIRARNLQIMHEPAAVVYHKVKRGRLTWSYMVRLFFWTGISDEWPLPKGHGGDICVASSAH